MKLFAIKKISLIFSLLLLSFSFWTIGVGDVKAQATCSVSENPVSTTKKIIVSFSNPDLPSGTGITASIKYLSPTPFWIEQFHTDPSGSYSAEVGSFPDEGLYQLSFNLMDSVPGQQIYQCNMFFEVKNPGGGGAGANPCVGNECETALGNIPTDPGAFAGKILTLAIGVAGGLALILMVIGSIRVLTSSGDPQRVAGGRDMIVAAVAGLLFLIFSVLILRFIGVHIVGLQ